MDHFKVRWNHDFPDEPVWLYSEIDGARREIRKVEIFAGGRSQWADASHATGDTVLSAEPLPAIKEIEEQSGFEPTMITRNEFERVWRKARKETLENK